MVRSVFHQSLLNLLVSLPIDQARMMVPDQNAPFISADFDRTLSHATVRPDLSHRPSPSVYIGPRADRGGEKIINRASGCLDPAHWPTWFTHLATRKLDVLLSQPQRHLTSASELIELVEDEPQHIGYFAIFRHLNTL